ncbi:MAG: hypothetical protein DLM67_02660 [Candidatus Nephthysia bennettiae]|uniref:Uncharacterized protein n=1 Tax=Candidatus Nephthysia bennettiae TaxID=3127016 RepID=A0A934N9I8_9BACT|nr:hypothetical protein [Candidatus Dormibacteraeota bacterium]MBJ7614940.1 hypothetical protein [Candidatus Dormibacteraeota bacterium]PZR99947.1 MAG: hypothetical protein DLM67_02660 [Candidatus Dormibacteraeota bacterium]
MRVQLTPRAQFEFDRFDPAEQQTILRAVRLEAMAARASRPRRVGHATIRLAEPATELRVQVSVRGALLVSIHRLSTG